MADARITRIMPVVLVLGIADMSAYAAADPEDRVDRVIFDFREASQIEQWVAVNDTVMGGVSTGQSQVTDQGILVFFGAVSLENNGGFASIRSRPAEINLAEFDGLMIRVRGAGQRYGFNVRTDVPIVAGSYRVKFDTKRDTWQEIFLPFAEFEATSFGRVIRTLPPLDPAKIRSFGFTISDKQDGPFKLEVDWIRAVALTSNAGDQATPAGEVDQRSAARDLINLAITRGVPLFNEGQPEACAAVYEVTVTGLITLAGDELPPPTVERLRVALRQASRAAESTDRAWVLRRALDDALGILSKAEPG